VFYLLLKGDSLGRHDGQKFSTRDQDNDASRTGPCAVNYKGGWWYNDCHDANLNGLYYDSGYYSATFNNGVVWHRWKGSDYSLRFTEMKIRSIYM